MDVNLQLADDLNSFLNNPIRFTDVSDVDPTGATLPIEF